MKINSNTIMLGEEERKSIEKIMEKVASSEKIENVDNIRISISNTGGEVLFNIAGEESD